MTTPPTESRPYDLSLTGPDLDQDRPLIGPDGLMDRARAAAQRDDDEKQQATALGKRLVVAFVMMLALSVAFIVLVAELNVHVPPIVFLLSFVAIAAGTILTVMQGADTGQRRSQGNSQTSCGCSSDDEGRPIGCCQGPRPLKMFRDR